MSPIEPEEKSMSHRQKREHKRRLDRRRNARSRFRHPTSEIRHGAAALAAAATIAAGTAAYAAPVRFDNPAHSDPGHYHWGELAPIQGFLSILDPFDQQPVPDPGGPGTFGHNLNPPGSGVGTGAANTNIQKGGFYDAFILSVGPGDVIPSGGGYSWAEYGIAYYPGLPNGGSEIPELTSAYLGVRFDIGGGYQYGWIGVNRIGFELEAFAWGYETTPGVSIPAGAVPEPGTLAMLALGAGALLRRKRPA